MSNDFCFHYENYSMIMVWTKEYEINKVMHNRSIFLLGVIIQHKSCQYGMYKLNFLLLHHVKYFLARLAVLLGQFSCKTVKKSDKIVSKLRVVYKVLAICSLCILLIFNSFLSFLLGFWLCKESDILIFQ